MSYKIDMIYPASHLYLKAPMPLATASRSPQMAPDQRPPENLPDPCLFDTPALIRN